MAGKGGYQRPTSPAPVSAPGSLSQRTDGGPGAMQGAKYIAGLPYGQGQEFQDMQQMAPMEAAPSTPSASSVGAAPNQLASGAGSASPLVAPGDINLVPLSAPSQRPYEPVTHGIPLGPGGGPEVLPSVVQNNAQAAYQSAQSVLQGLGQANPTNPAIQYLMQRLGRAF